MVERYLNKHFLSLLDFLKRYKNSDFYYTEQNNRKYINDEKELKSLLRISKDLYIIEERGDILGIVLLWVSEGNGIKRYFVKINAINKDIANNLLTVLLWNCDKELYTKIKKDSNFIGVFQNKGFKFRGDRGSELLLCRYNVTKVNKIIKEE